jgi:8-oxo-dGTP diphosphatase
MKTYLDKYIKIIVAVYIIFEKGGKILLLKRENTGYFDGSFSLPAGHLDGNETARAAASREVKEEVGLDISADDLKLVHVIHRKSSTPIPHERVDLYFKLDKWHGEPVNAEPHKHAEIKWYPTTNLPENMVPEVDLALKRIAACDSFSEFGFN